LKGPPTLFTTNIFALSLILVQQLQIYHLFRSINCFQKVNEKPYLSKC